MAKFTKKPVTIEAVQWFQLGDHPAVVLKTGPGRYADEGIPWISTLEGGHVVTPGDWIITGVKNENYPCKPDIFALTYEPASEPIPAAPAQAEPVPVAWRYRFIDIFTGNVGVWRTCTHEPQGANGPDFEKQPLFAEQPSPKQIAAAVRHLYQDDTAAAMALGMDIEVARAIEAARGIGGAPSVDQGEKR